MLIQRRIACRRSEDWVRCPGSGGFGLLLLCCWQRNCPSPRAARRRRLPCRSCCGNEAPSGDLADTGTCCCRMAAAPTGSSTANLRCARCASARPGDCPGRGGCCGLTPRLAAPGSGYRRAASTVPPHVAYGQRSPQGGHELLGSGRLGTCFTQKTAERAVRVELRFGFRVYSAGDMGEVPTGLPTGAQRR